MKYTEYTKCLEYTLNIQCIDLGGNTVLIQLGLYLKLQLSTLSDRFHLVTRLSRTTFAIHHIGKFCTWYYWMGYIKRTSAQKLSDTWIPSSLQVP